jgi:hypothetical protein
MWDDTWEILTHPKFAVGPHYGWEHTTDIFDVDNHLHTSSDPVNLVPIYQHKWAGWFDLYNKKFYEELAQIPSEWTGYGSWDYYGMNVSSYAKQLGYDFQQYRLDGQIIFEYGIGPLVGKEFSSYYRNNIICRDISEQRDEFNKKLEFYIKQRLDNL